MGMVLPACSFQLEFCGWRVFMNDEQTRTFLAIAAGLGATEVSLSENFVQVAKHPARAVHQLHCRESLLRQSSGHQTMIAALKRECVARCAPPLTTSTELFKSIICSCSMRYCPGSCCKMCMQVDMFWLLRSNICMHDISGPSAVSVRALHRSAATTTQQKWCCCLLYC
jgi:hypothetical protein